MTLLLQELAVAGPLVIKKKGSDITTLLSDLPAMRTMRNAQQLISLLFFNYPALLGTCLYSDLGNTF